MTIKELESEERRSKLLIDQTKTIISSLEQHQSIIQYLTQLEILEKENKR